MPSHPSQSADNQAQQPLELRAGPLRAELRADIGGCLSGLWWGETPVLRSRRATQLDSPRQAACYAMLPYSNRIGHGRLRWNGMEAHLARNFGKHPHPLHGFGWQREWQARRTDDRTVRMTLRHAPDVHWPFAMLAEQVVGLEFSAQGTALHASVKLTNTDTRIQPMGFGWHPYFLRRQPCPPEGAPAIKSPHLQAMVTGRWAKDMLELPTQLEPVAALDAPVDRLALDHGFEGWDGHASIEDEAFSLRLSSSLRRLVVYTPKPTAHSAYFAHFCVEPVSHASNAVQMADPMAQGLAAVAPGESVQGWMRLEIAPRRLAAAGPHRAQQAFDPSIQGMPS